MNSLMDEVARLKETYSRRDISGKSSIYSLFNTASLFMKHQREKIIIDTMNKNNLTDLSLKKILDLGCGTGSVLRDFINYGAVPENCFGIDLLADRIETAKRLSPNMDLRCSNAESLPYEDSFFEMILCFTVFTSIFDKSMKQNIANEMLRVLKPQGIIIWYDYHMNNPKNPDVRGVKSEEIQKLFANCKIHFKRTTLAPPLTRAIAPFSSILCDFLEKIPFLCTHYIATIRI